MVIEFGFNPDEEYVNDILEAKGFLVEMGQLVRKIASDLESLEKTKAEIDEQKRRINMLQDKLATIKWTTTTTQHRLREAWARKKAIKKLNFKEKAHNRQEIYDIVNQLDDLNDMQTRTISELSHLTSVPHTKIRNRKLALIKQDMFSTIRNLASTVGEYRAYRQGIEKIHGISLPRVDLCQIISTTPEGEIELHEKEVPELNVFFTPEGVLRYPVEIDGIQYEVEHIQ